MLTIQPGIPKFDGITAIRVYTSHRLAQTEVDQTSDFTDLTPGE